MRLEALERMASMQLALPLVIRRSDADSATTLNENERFRLAAMARKRRRRDWLLGRNALKQVLRELGLGEDTSTITFPDPRLSLTHSGNLSFATGTSAPLSGIGIDYEPLRDINPGIAHWFLRDDERQWTEKRSNRSEVLLRLWTVKEAAFKCYPANAGMVLKDFVIVDPELPVLQVATADREEPHIQVTSLACCSGWLSIAVCRDAA